MENTKRQRLWIISIYILISILGFIALGYFVNKSIDAYLAQSENIGIDIILSSGFALIAFEIYFAVIFLISLIGYFISKFTKKQALITAFKFLSWTYLIILLLFTAYWIIVP